MDIENGTKCMDPVSEQRLAQVHPELAAKVRAGAANLAARGVEIRVVQGLRSFADQDAEYAKGRTVLVDARGKPQGIVTRARGGYSAHNFGLAVDVVPGLQGAPSWTPDWRVSAYAFKAMIAELKQQGLKWGGDWVHMRGDYDHFYLAGSPDSPTEQMRADLAAGGLALVFQGCDAGKYCEVTA